MNEKKLYRAVTQMSPEIYKDFYKFYYSDRLRVFRVVSLVIAIIAIAAAVMLYYGGYNAVWAALLLWLGVFLLVYPNVAYRRPYKRERGRRQTTYFSFYENYVEERTNGEKGDYEYSALLKVVETPKYLFIYHTMESVSIVVKAEVKEGADGLCELLKGKTASYKKVK